MFSGLRNQIFKTVVSPPRKRKARQDRQRLKFEQLEGRRLLASNTLGGVNGSVFVDGNGNNTLDVGEEVANAQIRLFQDTNNNNNFDAADTLVDSDTTDVNGAYSFTGLTTGNYFAVQPAQTVGTINLPQKVSPRLTVDGNGSEGVIIDTFTTVSPQTIDTEPPGTPVNSVNVAAEAIGGQRDFQALLVSGMGDAIIEVRNGFLETQPSALAVGQYMVEWDGVDAAGSFNPIGLGNVDFTAIGGVTGQAQGICLVDILPNKAGQQLIMRLYTDANRFSVVTVSNLTEDIFQNAFLNFSGAGPLSFQPAGSLGGADFTDIGAATLEIANTAFGTDLVMNQLSAFGINFETADFDNDSPAPQIDVEKFTNGNQADLPTDSDVPIVAPGSTVTWTYQVTNTGTVPITTVTLVDDQIGTITNITAQGNGDSVLDPAEFWTYQATGTAITGLYGNQAMVTGSSARRTSRHRYGPE